MKKLLFLITGMALCAASQRSWAAEYYIAPGGNDANPGTAAQPWATLTKGAWHAEPGDTVWVHGGTYASPKQINFTKSGMASAPITFSAVPGEKPVLDYGGAPVNGLLVQGAWLNFKGLTVTHAGKLGIRITGKLAHDITLDHIICTASGSDGISLTSDTYKNMIVSADVTANGHNGIHLNGGVLNTTLKNCVAHANGNTGIQLDNKTANTLIVNCDSYENYDAPTHGEDADGFGIKHAVGPGNRLVGCRAWHNADDGYDCWYAGNPVHFENCYAWRNGENLWHNPKFTGNGNGFKLGQMLGSHVLFHCATWDQPQRGFDLNGNSSGVTVENCTAIRCKVNFAFTFVKGNAEKNVLRNNISFDGPVAIDPRMDDRHNSWNMPGITISAADFRSLDSKTLEGPRGVDGTLPQTNFLYLAPGSSAIDAGVDVGLPFTGKAPDLGAFETSRP